MVLDVAIQSLAGITIILFVGIVVSLLAKRLKIANVLLLLISGLVLSSLAAKDLVSVSFSNMFIVTIALLTLILVVFDGSSRFKMKLVDTYSGFSLKIFLAFLLLILPALSVVTSFIFFGSFEIDFLLLSSIFAITVAGTDPTSMFHILRNSSNRVIQILEIESIINTPFTIILPLIVIQILTNTTSTISSAVFSQITPLLLQITGGVGMGVVLGYFLPKTLKKVHSKELAPLVLLTFALIGYIVTELIGGSGVLCVATMGLFFGNVSLQKKEDIQNFNSVLSSIFVILVFILVGFIIPINLSWIFILKVIALSLIAFTLRYVALSFVLPRERFNLKEKLFMSLLIPKGVAVAVVVLSLAVLPMTGLESGATIISQLIVMTMLLSLIVATVLARFDRFFLKRVHLEQEKLKKEEEQLERKKEKLEKEIIKTKKKAKKVKQKKVKQKVKK